MRKKWWNGLLIVSGLLFSLPAFSQQRWERTYGGARWDWGRSVQETSDGGDIVAGITRSFGNDFQVYLIKTNASGDTLWTRTYGGAGREYGYSVQQTQDGGYIVVGESNFQVYLVKTNASGDTLWTRSWGVVGGCGYSIQQTTDGGYIVVGYPQVYLIKTNASGDTLWTRAYVGEGQSIGYSVQQTSDSGYIVTGVTSPSGYGNQVYLVKTNAQGDTLWTRTFGGADEDYGYSVKQTSDGGYIVVGETYSFPNSPQVYLIKTNASGDTLWTRTYGGPASDYGYSVQQTQDGGYIVAGYTESFGDSLQVYLIKTDANGNVGVENNASSRLTPHASRLTVSPNPFTSFASITGHLTDRFTLYDISGRKVGMYKGDRIGADLSAGVYFLRAEGENAKPLRVVKVR